MARALGVGLLGVDDADVIEELVPEAAVQQMQRGVLHAAVVPVDGQPVVELLAVRQTLVVMRIAVAHIVPARAGPVGHGVYLALGGTAALGAGGVDPVGRAG